jgi:hypothetical protein
MLAKIGEVVLVIVVDGLVLWCYRDWLRHRRWW